MDFDKLHELANNHRKLRLMLGRGKFNWDYYYALQTINDFLTQTAKRFEDKGYRGGIIDKTVMYEAVWRMSWHDIYMGKVIIPENCRLHNKIYTGNDFSDQ
jgi:hypothetical protein